jgi:hypothetical protein
LSSGDHGSATGRPTGPEPKPSSNGGAG